MLVIRSTLFYEYVGEWKMLYNPNFNYGEFATIRNTAGSNNFVLSVRHGLKEREPSALRAPTTITHLIELRKLMALEDACKQQHLDWGFYFNFFGNDTLYIYNIRDIRKYGYNSSGSYNLTTAAPSELVVK